MNKLGLKKGIKKSNELYKQALKYIGSGTNTFSRAPGVFPDGAAPKFLKKQTGSYVWDVDGNKYIDMVMGCGPVTLGHGNTQINNAIKKQLKDGILYSMLHPLEVEVAQKLSKCIPYGEMFKFSKNGSDVCAASIKIARHITKRDIILCWGYHGFQDWYVGTTDRNAGIPKAVRELTKTFEYHDLEGLKKLFKKHKNKVAAVIMEPVIGQKPSCSIVNGCKNKIYNKVCKGCPQSKFLKEVKKITHSNGSLLIFDEMISGFRFSVGGAGHYFGTHPDLATFGKGITNGMPLGVLAGRKKYMKHFDKVFLSSTYAPETLTLAAASATIDFYLKNNVVKKLWFLGEHIEEGFQKTIDKYDLNQSISLAGYPVRLMINTHDQDGTQNPYIASLYQQEMFKHGILCFSGVLMLSYSLTKEDLKIIIKIFDKTCSKIKEAVSGKKSISSFLTGKPNAPVFKGLRERNASSN